MNYTFHWNKLNEFSVKIPVDLKKLENIFKEEVSIFDSNQLDIQKIKNFYEELDININLKDVSKKFDQETLIEAIILSFLFIVYNRNYSRMIVKYKNIIFGCNIGFYEQKFIFYKGIDVVSFEKVIINNLENKFKRDLKFFGDQYCVYDHTNQYDCWWGLYKDKNGLYVGRHFQLFKAMRKIDISTFEPIYKGGRLMSYGKDKDSIYCFSKEGLTPFKDADPKTFEVIFYLDNANAVSDYVFTKDKNSAWFYDWMDDKVKKIKELNPATFKIRSFRNLGDKVFLKDGGNFYIYDEKVRTYRRANEKDYIWVDLKRWDKLSELEEKKENFERVYADFLCGDEFYRNYRFGTSYYRYRNAIYYFNNKGEFVNFKEADPESFTAIAYADKISEYIFSKDKKHVYFFDEESDGSKEIHELNPAEFKIWPFIAKSGSGGIFLQDDKHYYLFDEKLRDYVRTSEYDLRKYLEWIGAKMPKELEKNNM